MDFSEVPVACADSAWLQNEFLLAVDATLEAMPSVVVMPTDSHDESEFLLNRVKRRFQERGVSFVRELHLSPTDPTLAWEDFFGTPDARSSFDSPSDNNVLIVRGGNYLPAWFVSEHIARLEAYSTSYRVTMLLPLAREIAHATGLSESLRVPSFSTASEQIQRAFVQWAIEKYVDDLRDDPTTNRRDSREELCDIICQAKPVSRTLVGFWLRYYVTEFERQECDSILDVARRTPPVTIRALFPEPANVPQRKVLRAEFERLMQLLKELNATFHQQTKYLLFRNCHELPCPFNGPDPQHWFSSCISQFSCLYFDAAKKSGLDVAACYRVDAARVDIVSAERSPFLATLRLLRTYFQHALCPDESDDSKTLYQVKQWYSETMGTESNVARDNARLCLARLLAECRESVDQLANVVSGLGRWPTTYAIVNALGRNARTFAEHEVEKSIRSIIDRLELNVEPAEVVRLFQVNILMDVRSSTCKLSNLGQELDRIVEQACLEAVRRRPAIGSVLKGQGLGGRQIGECEKQLSKVWDENPTMTRDEFMRRAEVEAAAFKSGTTL